MLEIPPWYVMTGVPSSGKSTLIDELAIRGYHTVPEAARVLIDRYRTRGISAKELRRDERAFQQQVLQMKLETEKATPTDRIVFFDRGIPDSAAYFLVYSWLSDAQEVERMSRDRYKRIFLLEQLPFRQDYARTEDEATVGRLNTLLQESYGRLGYEVVFVPAAPIEDRIQLVLSRL